MELGVCQWQFELFTSRFAPMLTSRIYQQKLGRKSTAHITGLQQNNYCSLQDSSDIVISQYWKNGGRAIAAPDFQRSFLQTCEKTRFLFLFFFYDFTSLLSPRHNHHIPRVFAPGMHLLKILLAIRLCTTAGPHNEINEMGLQILI